MTRQLKFESCFNGVGASPKSHYRIFPPEKQDFYFKKD